MGVEDDIKYIDNFLEEYNKEQTSKQRPFKCIKTEITSEHIDPILNVFCNFWLFIITYILGYIFTMWLIGYNPIEGYRKFGTWMPFFATPNKNYLLEDPCGILGYSVYHIGIYCGIIDCLVIMRGY